MCGHESIRSFLCAVICVLLLLNKTHRMKIQYRMKYKKFWNGQHQKWTWTSVSNHFVQPQIDRYRVKKKIEMKWVNQNEENIISHSVMRIFFSSSTSMHVRFSNNFLVFGSYVIHCVWFVIYSLLFFCLVFFFFFFYSFECICITLFNNENYVWPTPNFDHESASVARFHLLYLFKIRMLSVMYNRTTKIETDHWKMHSYFFVVSFFYLFFLFFAFKFFLFFFFCVPFIFFRT